MGEKISAISVSVPPAFGPEEGDRANNVGPPVGVQGAREIFLASGPAFRAGARPPVFDNVDVYPVLARLIGVRPEPNDGDLKELGPALVR